jgi:hypothetical protein
MKKVIMVGLLVFASELYPISTTMNHRLITSAPLLYKQIDYAYEKLSIEFQPLISGMFDPGHTIANLTPGGAMTLSLNQQGHGDVNSAWLYLGASNIHEDYASTVTFTPTQQMYGGLFHCYKQFEHVFIDVKTSLLQCKNIVNLTETGGNNGGLFNLAGVPIYNAYDAFTQNAFQYGKIGVSNQLIGFDNIQVLLGASTQVATMQGSNLESYVAGFAVLEVPTGAGTKSEWLFEPQVGTNHWGFGFGVDLMFLGDNDFSFVFGGNFRHFIANWETRTFDLTANGAWSRYLLVESLAVLPGGSAYTGGLTVGLPAINFLTQDALIEGRNQITMYGRLQKRFASCLFEISYNLFYDESESITKVRAIPSGFGIYDIAPAGGVTTASTATISQAIPVQDIVPIALVTSDLNLASGAAGQWLNNTIAARLQRVQEFYTYGIGASVDLAHTAQGISSWSVWANFEILLPDLSLYESENLFDRLLTIDSDTLPAKILIDTDQGKETLEVLPVNQDEVEMLLPELFIDMNEDHHQTKEVELLDTPCEDENDIMQNQVAETLEKFYAQQLEASCVNQDEVQMVLTELFIHMNKDNVTLAEEIETLENSHIDQDEIPMLLTELFIHMNTNNLVPAEETKTTIEIAPIKRPTFKGDMIALWNWCVDNYNYIKRFVYKK